MNRMKRTLAGLLAALLAAASLAACTKIEPAPVSPSAASSAVSVSEPSPAPSEPPAATPPATPAATVHRDSDETNAAYLELYFGVKPLADPLGWAAFGPALSAVSQIATDDAPALDALPASGEVRFEEAVRAAVTGAHMKELALTYTPEKTLASLSKHAVPAQISDADAPYVATALDMGLIADTTQPLTIPAANALLMAVADANGLGRSFIGYSDEPDIYGKLINAREAFVMFDSEKLSAVGAKAVTEKLTTGYNLRSANYDANFLPALTLRYGHSTTIHAAQLLGLLASEGLVARVQLEPKTSIFEYLPEWGDVPPATPDYKVEVVSDTLMLAHSLEYDMVLEFQTEADKLAFDKLVGDFAKKNKGNEDGAGLLFASWWQPLYVSHVEMGAGYQKIYDNVITDGIYSLHPFCLEKDLDAVSAGFKKLDPTLTVAQVPIWCNDAFFRYLNGDDSE